MEDATDFDDWELLYISDDFKAIKDLDGESGYEVIKSDYFSLDSDKGGAMDGGSVWGQSGKVKEEMGIAAIGFSGEGSKGFGSDELLGDRRSMPESERRDFSDAGDSIVEAGIKEITDGFEEFSVEIEKNDLGCGEEEVLDLRMGMLHEKHVVPEGFETLQLSEDIVPIEEADVDESNGGFQSSDLENPKSDSGAEGGELFDVVKIGDENSDQGNARNVEFYHPEIVSGVTEELPDSMDRSNASDSTVEMSSGNGSSEDPSLGEGEEKTITWWTIPLEVFNFCVFRIKPIWPISIAGAVLALVVVRRRLRIMKHKSRSIPLRINVDDKKASELMVQAARLNAELSTVKRVPILRTIPAGGVTPWPVISLR